MICGDIIADVGSDHAYLPVWLYLNNKIKKAYALDISENCVNRIKINLKKYNIPEDIIIPVLSDGLACFDSDRHVVGTSGSPCPTLFNFYELTDIIIAGMGGETIAGIISQIPVNVNENFLNGASRTPRPTANFILQPNSKIITLREFLYDNNFEIIQDITVESKKRRYTVINARLRNLYIK